jgi:OOP family OmpA-OmpF porin
MKAMEKLVHASMLVGALAAGNVLAAEDGTGFYAGASAGMTSSSSDTAAVRNSLSALGFASSVSSDTSDFGFKVFAGYGFTRHLAVEAGYFDAGKAELNAITIPSGRLFQTWSATGFNVDGVFRYPVTDRFSVLARAGVVQAEGELTTRGNGAVTVLRPNLSESKTSWKVGLGAEFRIVAGFAVRAEWERYRLPNGAGGDGDVDLFSLGAVYRF